MEKAWFYNRYGRPEIILLRDKSLFIDRLGNNIGFVKDSGAIYNYNGLHCGWLENDVIRDLKGFSVGFSKNANDGLSPIFPIPQIPPVPPIPQTPPVPPIPRIPQIKPIKRFGWSSLFPLTLFR